MRTKIQIALLTVGFFGIIGTVGALDNGSIALHQALVQWAMSFAAGYVAIKMETEVKA